MIYPRLYLARNLLSNDGIIFISIDDNELANLRKICDEIFGENSFLGSFVWKKRHGQGKQTTKSNYSFEHEYILAYSKNGNFVFKGAERNKDNYSNPDSDPRGNWSRQPIDVGSTKEERPNCFYDLIDPATGNVFKPNPRRVWAFYPPTMQKLIEDKRIVFDPTGKTRPFLKKFWSELENENVQISSWIKNKNETKEETIDELASLYTDYNTNATKFLNEIFGDKIFDYPKPMSLIESLVHQIPGDDFIVLDFFAGSATTAHAVLDLNKKDGGKRKFIMVQLPEPTQKNSISYTSGYKNISDIAKERIRRVIKKIKAGTGQDLGFKVFKLDKSNFNAWDGTDPDNLDAQLQLGVDRVDPESTDEDILYEVMLKDGFLLTEKPEVKNIDGKKVYSFGDGFLLVCLEKNLTKEFIKQMAELMPKTEVDTTVIFLDEGFHDNDQLLVNAVEIFKSRNEKINFRIV